MGERTLRELGGALEVMHIRSPSVSTCGRARPNTPALRAVEGAAKSTFVEGVTHTLRACW